MVRDPFLSITLVASSHSISSPLHFPFPSHTANLHTHTDITTIPTILPPISAILPIKAVLMAQWVKKSCEEWYCFNLFLLPQSMDRDNSAHNHWFLFAQTIKIGILQVAVSEEDTCAQNGKPITPSSLISSKYYH